jgi:hypothetical protein
MYPDIATSYIIKARVWRAQLNHNINFQTYTKTLAHIFSNFILQNQMKLLLDCLIFLFRREALFALYSQCLFVQQFAIHASAIIIKIMRQDLSPS